MCYVVVAERQDWSRIGWMAKWSLPGLYMIEYGTVKNILKFLPFCKEYKEWEYLKKCPASHQQLICVCLCFFISLKFSALEFSCLEFKKVAAISKYFFLFRTLSNHIWPFCCWPMARQLFNRRHQPAIFKNQYGPNFIVPPFSLIQHQSIIVSFFHF